MTSNLQYAKKFCAAFDETRESERRRRVEATEAFWRDEDRRKRQRQASWFWLGVIVAEVTITLMVVWILN